MRSVSFRSALLSLLLASPAVAQIDQQQTNYQYLNNPGTYGTSQSFKPTAHVSYGAGIWLYNAGATTNPLLNVGLWSGGLPYNGGTLIASGLGTATVATGESLFLDAFWNPVSVIPGTTYFLSFRVDQNGSGVRLAFTDDLYGPGMMHFSASSQAGAAHNLTYPQYDLTFREYGADATATPEPASLVLIATGLVTVCAFARRRRVRE